MQRLNDAGGSTVQVGPCNKQQRHETGYPTGNKLGPFASVVVVIFQDAEEFNSRKTDYCFFSFPALAHSKHGCVKRNRTLREKIWTVFFWFLNVNPYLCIEDNISRKNIVNFVLVLNIATHHRSSSLFRVYPFRSLIPSVFITSYRTVLLYAALE